MLGLLVLLHAGLFGVLLGNVLYLRQRRGQTMPDPWPSVSILIPARNEADNLRRLLPSLLDQQYPDFEVIVYDDGSEDATWSVLQSIEEERLRPLRGDGPPAGWAGKVHALFQATRAATGDLFLFLDADAQLEDADALKRLVARHQAHAQGAVLTGLTRLRGGGKLLVSLVPNAMLEGLPWPLVRHTRAPRLAALNGQCWMIEAALYRQHEPHRHHPNAVLEDVRIGHYLKAQGVAPMLVDVQQEVSVFMYAGYADAWRGFRKNAYLLMGGAPLPFVLFFFFYLFCFVLPPVFSGWLLLSLYGLKFVTDRRAGFPFWVSLLAPLSYLMGSVLQLDSAVSHWAGRASWKGRRVSHLSESQDRPAPHQPEGA